MQLTDKVAIVTGAGRGIGRAIALKLAQAGAHIVVAEYVAEQAHAVAAEIRALGGQALAVSTDVTQESSVAEMLAQTLEHFGTVDLLVANAGIQRRYFVHELPSPAFSEMLSVNLLGVFHSCKAVLPTLYARRSGTIIIVASDSGKHGYAHNAAYCASKFGVLGFMEALADEARAYKVRVNAICPAGVKTAMSSATPKTDGSPLDTRYFMEPDEIADVALFLATPQSRAIHGQSLQVYGGVDYQLL
ncbi:NAD(P)-dependent oxidoreductase [Dictyobacter alpinus]|uniref:NAD(P)-dependent oxidoreductase n=1 Tax=Dictyobacter alpinus TaxID=2014873 RepID=A0A402BEF2_9CHLR|nr:SDR family NAD(P)-dependent oxidoreductase [Dictyobacter alpinus]GCE29811.1 NAD(P)-dependent oxidoreductase [Dictyobacter alpinus]